MNPIFQWNVAYAPSQTYVVKKIWQAQQRLTQSEQINVSYSSASFYYKLNSIQSLSSVFKTNRGRFALREGTQGRNVMFVRRFETMCSLTLWGNMDAAFYLTWCDFFVKSYHPYLKSTNPTSQNIGRCFHTHNMGTYGKLRSRLAQK